MRLKRKASSAKSRITKRIAANELELSESLDCDESEGLVELVGKGKVELEEFVELVGEEVDWLKEHAAKDGRGACEYGDGKGDTERVFDALVELFEADIDVWQASRRASVDGGEGGRALFPPGTPRFAS